MTSRLSRRRVVLILAVILIATAAIIVLHRRDSGRPHRRATLHPTTNQEIYLRYEEALDSQLQPQATRGCFLTWASRDSELADLKHSVRQLEDRFNHRYRYPFIILSRSNMTTRFEKEVRAMTKANVVFDVLPDGAWVVPSWVDDNVMEEAMDRYRSRGIVYGGNLGFRLRNRYFAGPLADHPALAECDYYWRFEPGVHYTCDIPYDPFALMKEKHKKFGFILAWKEVAETVPTLWSSVLSYLEAHPERFTDRSDLVERDLDPAPKLDNKDLVDHGNSNAGKHEKDPIDLDQLWSDLGGESNPDGGEDHPRGEEAEELKAGPAAEEEQSHSDTTLRIVPDPKRDNLGFVTDAKVIDKASDYNLCHFWTNFEIVDLSFLRSTEYRQVFRHFDHDGGNYGIFYERWADPPLRSMAVALLLSRDEVQYFEDIGYSCGSLSACPINAPFGQRCSCELDEHTQQSTESCTKYWRD